MHFLAKLNVHVYTVTIHIPVHCSIIYIFLTLVQCMWSDLGICMLPHLAIIIIHLT